MYGHDALSLLSGDEIMLDGDEIVTGFRDRRGCYSVGCWEDDPEMLEYEEILCLGASLGAYA